jgi:hypothetical protein
VHANLTLIDIMVVGLLQTLDLDLESLFTLFSVVSLLYQVGMFTSPSCGWTRIAIPFATLGKPFTVFLVLA